MGDAYFSGMAEISVNSSEKEKLKLLAKVEQCTAARVRPLLEKHELKPRPVKELISLAQKWIEQRRQLSWSELISDMVKNYPVYIEQFEALESMAPQSDLSLLRKLTEHEMVLVDFANRESEGRHDSLEPVLHYIEQNDLSHEYPTR
jgi:hypothetical protein